MKDREYKGVIKIMGKLLDLTGETINRIYVIEREGLKNGKAAWKCKCHWRTIKITVNGVTKSLKEWCCYLNLNYNTIYRKYRLNEDIEEHFSNLLSDLEDE